MNKTTTIIVIASILILVGGVFLLTRESTNNQVLITTNNDESTSSTDSATRYQYFWSKTCPHCANVAEYLENWEGKDILEMEKYEVNESEENTKLFIENGTKICNKPSNRLGVPLLITPTGECISGDTPIIEYLNNLDV